MLGLRSEEGSLERQDSTGPGPAGAGEQKLGLALSGGGFRASFFHIGVLARMATMGLLRHVEVISTVSGGSIIGALYYLHVKTLLESRTDDEITDQDYLAIVERIEGEFLAAVQKNIRMRTFLNVRKNLRMSLANYSRSDRIGELYDALIYRPAVNPSRSTPIQMRELKIQPKGGKNNFYPLDDNAGRKAKVPILLINATTLNTGHNWRFEASRMGEPPRTDPVAMDIDKKLRLRRPPSYDDIIPKQQDIELGLAVAASACVPGIFHPLAISDLYPDAIRVQLVDGGVHDNQGVEGLVDIGCTAFVVSDASGQMKDEADPATGLASVLARTNSIFMDRVREEELFRLLQGADPPVALMHLRKGLPATAVSWIGPNGEPAEPPVVERQPAAASESFGVAQPVQRFLSQIRTDLDSFTEVEAYSLMLDGYQMSEAELRRPSGIRAFIRSIPADKIPAWCFLSIAPWMMRPNPAYLRQLSVAGETLFKIFWLSPGALGATIACTAIVLLGLWYVLGDTIVDQLSRTVSVGWLLAGGLLVGLSFVPGVGRLLTAFRFLQSPAKFAMRLATRALPAAVGSLFVWIHLKVFDPLFLRLGTLRRLEPPQ